MTMEAGTKQTFSEPFRSELIRALKGHSPWKAHMPKVGAAYKPIPPSGKQLAFLKRLGGKSTPASMQEASQMIEELLGRK